MTRLNDAYQAITKSEIYTTTDGRQFMIEQEAVNHQLTLNDQQDDTQRLEDSRYYWRHKALNAEDKLRTCRDTIDRYAAKHGPYFDYIMSIIEGTATYDPSMMDDREYVKLTQAINKRLSNLIESQEKRIAELEKQLEDANECLTIAYMQGFSDCKDKGGDL